MTEAEHAEALASILDQAEETTLGPTDSALVAKALRLLADRVRADSDMPEVA